MPIRTAITRVTGQGEQFVVDVCQWNPVTGEIMHPNVADMRELANDMLELSDMRMYEMNMRMLEAYGLEKYFEPATWQRIVQLLDILAGRSDISTVLQRWEATKEENAELEAGRLRAMSEQECRKAEVLREATDVIQAGREAEYGYTTACGCAVSSDGGITLCEKHN